MRVRYSQSESKDPLQDRGVKIPYAPAKRVFPKWRWYLVVLIVSSPLWFFLAKVGLGLVWVTSPGIVYMDKTPINSPMSGIVSKIYLKSGQKVVSGDPLARVIDPTLEVRKKPLLAERDAILNNPRQKMFSGSVGDSLALAKRVFERERRYLETVQRLFDLGAATVADLNEARGRVDRAEADLARAKADMVTSSIPPVEFRERRVRLIQIEAELEAMSGVMGDADLTSPVSGTILEVFAVENQSISQGAPIAVIADPKEVSILAFLDPEDLSLAEMHESVTVAFPGRTMIEARVDGLPSMAQPTPSSLSRPLTDVRQAVKVTLRAVAPIPDMFLVEGLPVTVHWGSRWRWIERWLP